MKEIGDAMGAAAGYTSQYSWQLYDTAGTTEDDTYAATGGFAGVDDAWGGDGVAFGALRPAGGGFAGVFRAVSLGGAGGAGVGLWLLSASTGLVVVVGGAGGTTAVGDASLVGAAAGSFGRGWTQPLRVAIAARVANNGPRIDGSRAPITIRL